MSIFDEVLPKTAQEEMFDNIDSELLDKLNNLISESGINLNDVSLEFKDPDFLIAFFQKISKEEQIKYLLATYNYEHGKDCDINYLLAFRIAIYTEYEKNENFWSTDFRCPRFGLKREQPIGSPIRLYSSIMVTTVGKLMNHGLALLDHVGATDGEIAIDDSKPFSDFLFVYKPKEEKELLNPYIATGGMSYEDTISYLNDTSLERKRAQGFKR